MHLKVAFGGQFVCKYMFLTFSTFDVTYQEISIIVKFDFVVDH